MEFQDLVALYFERTNAMEVLWSFYLSIVLGILGFIGAVRLKAPRLRILLLLSIAFFAFAWVNCGALRGVTNQRNVVANLIRQFKSEPTNQHDPQIQVAISGTLDPPTVTGVTWFHVTGDIFTLSAIWLLGLRQRSSPH